MPSLHKTLSHIYRHPLKTEYQYQRDDKRRNLSFYFALKSCFFKQVFMKIQEKQSVMLAECLGNVLMHFQLCNHKDYRFI